MQEKPEEISEFSERLSQAIECLKVSRNKFGKDLGYDPAQTIYDLTNGKSKPSFDFFERFLMSEHSEIVNVEWLISGKGIMFKNRAYETNNIDLRKESVNKEKRAEYSSSKDQSLLELACSQQRVIEDQQKTIDRDSRIIERLTKKNIADSV